MLKIFIFALLLLSSPTPDSLKFVSGKIDFTIRNMGFAVDGSMGGVDIVLTQPSANAATWTIEGTADPSTIATGIALRDKHLQKQDYFDVDHFPKIRLRSVTIKSKGGDRYDGIFALTIKDITRNVVIPFVVKKNGDLTTMEGTFTINRLDYSLGEKSTILSDDVKIKVAASFQKDATTYLK
jgi:polyisoprenoid-binding protein YceI